MTEKIKPKWAKYLIDKCRKEAETAEQQARRAGYDNDSRSQQYWTGYANAMRRVLVDIPNEP